MMLFLRNVPILNAWNFIYVLIRDQNLVVTLLFHALSKASASCLLISPTSFSGTNANKYHNVTLPQIAVNINTTKCGMIVSLAGEAALLYPRIRDLREDHDKRQKELAEYLNCSQQVYSNYELGQRDVPTEILIKLSEYYNVSTDYILGLSSCTTRIP